MRLALDRCAAPPQGAVVIGDTPADIEAGHANGVRVIAVATGRSTETELRLARAEKVLPDLRNTERLVKLTYGSDP